MFDVICVTAEKYCNDFLKQTEKIAQSGVKAIVLREKNLSEDEYIKLAEKVKNICIRYGTKLVIHNFVSVAKRLKIKNIQLPFSQFCKYENLKKDFEIIGTSVHSVEDAVYAEKSGADYIVAGHIFSTDCKKGLTPRGAEFLENVCLSVDIPVYAIGGIEENSVRELKSIKCKNFAGVCVMSGLMKSENPKAFVNSLKENYIIQDDRQKYLLYAITSRQWLDGRDICEDVEKALRGGATLVQLREKEMNLESLCVEADKVHKLCQKYGVPLIINDSVKAAKIIGAEGVHLGQGDESPLTARKKLGKDKTIGVTARSVKQAIKAEAEGADYLGCGAVFGTSTKNDATKVSIDTLNEICKSVKIPVVAIGGINKSNIEQLNGTKISGAAVVSGIFAEKDIENSARELKDIIEVIVNGKT